MMETKTIAKEENENAISKKKKKKEGHPKK